MLTRLAATAALLLATAAGIPAAAAAQDETPVSAPDTAAPANPCAPALDGHRQVPDQPAPAEPPPAAPVPGPPPVPARIPASADSPAPASAADAPRAHCSQNAGDEQYQDPFSGVKSPSKSKPAGGAAQGSQGGTDAEQTGSQAQTGTAAQTQAGDPSAAGAGGKGLPNTGLPLAPTLLGGLVLLLGGLTLRRRLLAPPGARGTIVS